MNIKAIGLILFFVVVAVLGSLYGKTERAASPVVVESPSSIPSPEVKDITQSLYSTNSWFSSAYSFPSYPLFSYPGAFKVYDKGLGISSPQLKATEKTVFGSYDEMCTVNAGSAVTGSKVLGYGDWNVMVELFDATGSFVVSLVQGMPQTYVSGASELTVSCIGGIVTVEQNTVTVTRGAAQLLFEAKDGANVDIQNQTEFILKSPEKLYRITVLPNNELKNLDIFSQQAWNQVRSTEVSYNVASNGIETRYNFITDLNSQVITTIWPHHGVVTGTTSLSLPTYTTVLGQFQPVLTKSFTTREARVKLVEQFTEVKNLSRQATIKKEISNDAQRLLKEKSPDGVYFKGTWIGALTSLIQLADLYKMEPLRDQLVARLESELTSGLSQFTYDPKQKMYVALKPEFGNELGNDHHFHYGYYIRASAVLVKYKPSSLPQLSPVISEMVADIATIDPNDSRYPRLRAYSVYEGHSWADGKAHFADGNDQESTSEALNAWYGVWLWGTVTQNSELQTRGEWLFSQELTGTRAYWFGINNPFPEGYQYPIASLVWGGKRDFSTWFSADPVLVYGIQFLPITPASGYLERVSNGLLIENSLRTSNPATNAWGDLYVAYLSYFNPDLALKLAPTVKSQEGLKLSSLFYQTLYSNIEE